MNVTPLPCPICGNPPRTRNQRGTHLFEVLCDNGHKEWFCFSILNMEDAIEFWNQEVEIHKGQKQLL